MGTAIRKYRQRYRGTVLFFATIHGGNRIHDSIKGWGTISASGKTVLWDTYTKPKRTRKLSIKQQQKMFNSIVFPVVGKVMPSLNASDFLGCNKMGDS